MPLYNRLLEREDIKDEDKKHYQFWEDVEKSPVGKANKWLNQGASSDTSPEQKQLYRSGEKGKVLQGLQYVNDALDVTQTVVGLPVRALGWAFGTAAEGLSDATGYDKRSVNTALTIAGLARPTYRALNKSPAAHQAVHQAGQNVGRNVDRLRSQAKFAKDQFQYATGQKLRPLYKKPDPYTNITQVFEGSPSYLRRVGKIYRHHEGGISWKKSMEIAKRLPEGKGPYDPKVYLSPEEVKELGLNEPLQMTQDPYNPNYKPTSKKDLDLYGKQETDFNQVNSFDEGFEAAEVSISAYPGKRWPGLDLKIGDQYVKFYQSKGEVKVLPYNKWHQLRRSPFKVPKGIKSKLQKHEGGQLDLLNPNNEIVKYDQGTVNQFIDYTNKELDYQRAVQRLTEKLAKKALEAAGLPYRRNKTNISVDKSHAVPRSKGGSGYTFLEYWRANQQAGARDILDDQVLLDLGIPRNWNEYFIRWHQEQGKGNPATDLGRLSEISWDDYDQASKGADINTIKIRRKTINHFIQRQLEDPTFADQPTLPDEVPPGMENWTNRDQFELLVRESKGFNMDQDVIGAGDIESTFNAKQFDLKWRAETFGEVDQLKSDIQLDKKFKKAKRQATKQHKLDQSKIRIQTQVQEDKGQQSATDKLLGPKELRKIKDQLDKDLPD